MPALATIALASALVFSPNVTDGTAPAQDPEQPTISIVSTDCSLQGDSGCADDYDDFWAQDAYRTFAAQIHDCTDQQIKDAFVDTYYGTYATAPNWGPMYISVPSATYTKIFHVFKVVTTNPANQQAGN